MYQIIYCETTGYVRKTFCPPKRFLLSLFVHFWHIATYLPGVWISDERTMELDVSSLWVSLFVSCLLKCSWFTMLWLFQVYRKVIHTHTLSLSLTHTHTHTHTHTGFLDCSAGEESTCKAGDTGSTSRLGRSPGWGKWKPTPVFLPEKSYIQRSLMGCSP